MRLVVLIFLVFIVLLHGHIVKRQATNEVFQDVCPCVIHPESQQCISYDSRYIAVNYEEAILSFLDLSKHSSNAAPLINSNTFSCRTQECQQCFSLLYYKLGDLGFIPSDYRSSISPLPQSQLRPNLCARFNFPRPAIVPVAPPNVPGYLQSLINAGRQFRSTISAQSPHRSRSNHGSPPSASPPIPQNNRNNNNNQNNQNGNFNSPNNRNQNQNQRNPQNMQGQRNFNQNNQLQNQRTQFRNNQAMRNRFNAQQRANNFQNNVQRPSQQNQNFQQRPWQGQQQPRFQQPQFQNPRPLQNLNGVQQHWNGRFWEPAGRAIGEAIRNPIQNAVGNGWQNGWGQQGNGWGQQGNGAGGAPPQSTFQPAPAPAPAPAVPQPIPWTGNGGFGGNGGFNGGWGGGGSGENNNNHGFSLFGIGFKNRQKRADPPTVIGKRFTINCMQRGDSEDDMLALCGWGECVQQYRNVDVLRRDNGRWVPTVITTSTCCDCRVRAGTEIHSLVIGDKHR
uniref:Protein pygopus n=1 Tax=Caenorhabditis tropicalis TaxID=1561998 RepID=A0A1I7UAH0_9PELO